VNPIDVYGGMSTSATPYTYPQSQISRNRAGWGLGFGGFGKYIEVLPNFNLDVGVGFLQTQRDVVCLEIAFVVHHVSHPESDTFAAVLVREFGDACLVGGR
jgi:hypothetical protein